MIYWILYKSSLPRGTYTSYDSDYMVKKICTSGEDSAFAQEPLLWDERPPIPWPEVLDCSPDMKIDHFELKAVFLTLRDANNYSLFLEGMEESNIEDNYSCVRDFLKMK